MIYTVKKGETVYRIAINHRLSLHELLSANPTLEDPNHIYPGQKLTVPGIPNPETISYTIDVSTEQKKLILYKDGSIVKKYPIAVGKIVSQTPVGEYVIVNREENPGGPYGDMWLTLSKSGYGIHGTNNPSSIGKAVSLGCIRMHNDDVVELASYVPNGTRVTIHP